MVEEDTIRKRYVNSLALDRKSKFPCQQVRYWTYHNGNSNSEIRPDTGVYGKPD